MTAGINLLAAMTGIIALFYPYYQQITQVDHHVIVRAEIHVQQQQFPQKLPIPRYQASNQTSGTAWEWVS